MEKQSENKIHVTSKLFIAVDIQLLGINYICGKPFTDKEELLASYQKYSFLCTQHSSSHRTDSCQNSSIALDKENPDTLESQQGGLCIHPTSSTGATVTLQMEKTHSFYNIYLNLLM